ncbi:MAG: hypothetical protein NTW87_14965 [Planctomycetota bacterium]|nr:hypothetical protein [Planctomycetota bacterium]
MRTMLVTLIALSALCLGTGLPASEEKAPATGEKPKEGEEAWKAEIAKKLEGKVSFEFVDTPLEEALSFLNSVTKVKIVIDPRAAADGANKTPINLKVKDMSVKLALEWICKLGNLKYELQNQAVFVTLNKEAAAPAQKK